ncbi:hypothetical protein GQ457_16G003830 [Hibiscus cannabinus]
MMAAAASNLKPVSLELGGKSPLLIFDDANIDQAADIAFRGMFFNKGEICVASSRVFVQEGIYEKLKKKLVEKAKATVVGDPFDPKVHQGPQTDKKQFEKILFYIDKGKTEGAKLLVGGNRVGQKGYFIEPTIFADVKDDMTIAKEENFWTSAVTMEEAIERANITIYGLAAGIITKNLNVANTVSRSIRAGVIWINCYTVFDMDCPYGGYKMSAFGRDFGLEALDQYLQTKSVVTPVFNSPWFDMNHLDQLLVYLLSQLGFADFLLHPALLYCLAHIRRQSVRSCRFIHFVELTGVYHWPRDFLVGSGVEFLDRLDRYTRLERLVHGLGMAEILRLGLRLVKHNKVLVLIHGSTESEGYVALFARSCACAWGFSNVSKVIAKVSLIDAEDVDLAVKATHHAFDLGPWPCMFGSVPFEASGLLKPPNLAHHLEKAREPDHIDFAEMSGNNKSEWIVEESCHIKCDRLSGKRCLLIDDDMTISKEEIFGPVLCLMKFKTMEEGIKRENITTYGLGAGIITTNLNVANTVSRSIRPGVIWINCYTVFDMDYMDCPYGGYNMSGFGGDFGLEALDQYLQVKSIVTPVLNSSWY